MQVDGENRMKIRPFGRHLHNQVAIPLLIALVAVGVIATIVAVAMVDRIVQRWIGENASMASTVLSAHLQDDAEQMQRAARLVAQNPAFSDAVSRGDGKATLSSLVSAYETLKSTQDVDAARDVTDLTLLDDRGAVLDSAGGIRLVAGQRPLSERTRDKLALALGHPVLLRLGGKATITAVETLRGPEGHSRLLLYSVVLDDGFVSGLAAGTQRAVALYAEDGSLLGSAVTDSDTTRLTTALSAGTGRIGEALSAAERDGTLVTRRLRLGGADYRVTAERIGLDGDPGGLRLSLVTVLGTSAAEQAQAATTGLIVLWSLVAVLALVLVDVWVAHRVSDPLATLSDSARKVAGGDFSVKVPVVGDNEIAQLSGDFNRMTDALREHSDSLTKKVLELAALYEMSRSLGATLDLDALLDSVLDSALRIFDVELGYVTLRDPGSGELRMRAWRGGMAAPILAVRSSMCDWVIREGRPLIFNPVAEGAGDRREPLTGAQAALCVPLVSGEGTIGAMTVGSRDAEHRFTSDDVRLLATMANQVTIAVGNAGLFSSLQDAYLATVRALAAAVDAKDPYTRGHSEQVARFSLSIADAMDLSAEQRTALEMAAYLHDIGKIGISEEILLKPGRLTDDEMAQMRHHPLIGANILRPVAFPWPITPLVRHHHEHFDGTGYPAGLRGEEIPLLARVLTVADAFDAMVADRPYRRGRSREEAALELRRCSGTHFDPRVVDAFIGVLERQAAERPAADADTEGPDRQEALAVFMAVCDGMMLSFRRLGGPRLASNLERDLNDAFTSGGMGYLVSGGRLVLENDGDGKAPDAAELRAVIRLIGTAMERTSGSGLVEHFRADAVVALPARMRAIAMRMRLLADD